MPSDLKSPHPPLTAAHQVIRWGIAFVLAATAASATGQSSEFEQWRAQLTNEYQTFRTEQDQAFIEYLENEWEEFAVFKGEVRDRKPKPRVAPLRRQDQRSRPTDIFQTAVITRPNNLPLLEGFYGHVLPTLEWPAIALPDLSKPTEKRLSSSWANLSDTDFSNLIAAINAAKLNLELGDWATYQLALRLSERKFKRPNEAKVISWFLLNQLGLDVRLAYYGRETYLLLPSTIKVYGRDFLPIDNQRFYIYPEPPQAEGAKLRSYDRKSNPAMNPLDLRLTKSIKEYGEAIEITAQHPRLFAGRTLELPYDFGIQAFYQNYPQLDLKWYFAARPKYPLAVSLQKELSPWLEGMTKRQKANTLLSITQRLFNYQTDEEQFQREKYLFLEESLHYGNNDCEDRSIFLAWLLRDLLGVDVIALDYPGHVALAVLVPATKSDTIVNYRGKTYVVADPTYNGADLGMVIPDVKSQTPQIIGMEHPTQLP